MYHASLVSRPLAIKRVQVNFFLPSAAYSMGKKNCMFVLFFSPSFLGVLQTREQEASKINILPELNLEALSNRNSNLSPHTRVFPLKTSGERKLRNRERILSPHMVAILRSVKGK